MQIISKEPSKELRSIIREIWKVEFFEDEKVSHNDLIMPTGTLHVVFNFGDDYFAVHSHGAEFKLPAILVAGQLDRVWRIRYGKNTSQLGLSLTPAGFMALFNVPGALYSGTFLDGNSSPWNLSPIYKTLKATGDWEQASSLVESYVLKESGVHKSLDRVNRILEFLEESKGCVSMIELAAEYGLSISAFERNFKKAVGITPKAYANIVRFRTAMKQLDEENELADLFYDQSHFIKSCKKYTGKTPMELINGIDEITLNYMLGKR